MAGKVLVVQLARLGDLVQTWPLLNRLHHQNPGRPLDLLADRPLTALQARGPEVDQIWGLDLASLAALAKSDLPGAYDRVRSLAADLRSHTYDEVYNLNFSRVALLLAYLVGGKIRGYQPVSGGREFLREPWLALVYALVHSRQVNRVHLSDVFRHLAPAREPGPPELVPQAIRTEPIIALQVATRHPKRTWPLEAFTRLAGLLINRLGAWIWLVGTKAEAPIGEALIQGLTPAQRQRVVNLQGRTDLTELASRLGEAHLLISGDTGTLHLAAALRTRSVGIFLGPASCFETGPYGEGHYVFQAEPPCHPCAEAGAPCPEAICQAMIPPEAVADLAVLLCRGEGEATSRLSLPAGTRLYRSTVDALGVSFTPLQAGYRFIDLVGLAYRRAGARLLGLPGPAGPPPLLALKDEDWRNLEGLVAVLGQGRPTGDSVALEAALTPLKAFGQEMSRRRLLGGDEDTAAACFATVAHGFQAGLEELGTAAASMG
jgi:ADP-heptose:LPS heptosyltransferase